MEPKSARAPSPPTTEAGCDTRGCPRNSPSVPVAYMPGKVVSRQCPLTGGTDMLCPCLAGAHAETTPPSPPAPPRSVGVSGRSGTHSPNDQRRRPRCLAGRSTPDRPPRREPAKTPKGGKPKCMAERSTRSCPPKQRCPKHPADDQRETAHTWMSRVITAHTGEYQTGTPRDKTETSAGRYTRSCSPRRCCPHRRSVGLDEQCEAAHTSEAAQRSCSHKCRCPPLQDGPQRVSRRT